MLFKKVNLSYQYKQKHVAFSIHCWSFNWICVPPSYGTNAELFDNKHLRTLWHETKNMDMSALFRGTVRNTGRWCKDFMLDSACPLFSQLFLRLFFPELELHLNLPCSESFVRLAAVSLWHCGFGLGTTLGPALPLPGLTAANPFPAPTPSFASAVWDEA